jgi:ABC-type multidrug transport system ATPase subunit
LIELQQVSKRYGRRGSGREALRTVSLQVPSASVWAVVGPNGAGKSTLLSLVLGFLRPSAGAALVAGEPARDYVRLHGAGYLPERFSLPGSWRVGETLRLLARLEDDAVGWKDVVAELGLEHELDSRLDQVSRGTLQRVGLAQTLLAPHALVVLDEPTEGLDPVWRVRLRDVIARLRDRGATVLLASHDLAEVERVADRAVLLHDGGIREIIELQQDAQAETRFRILLATSCDRFGDAFPLHTRDAADSYLVDVDGPAELSARLGALVALGGVVVAVEPLRRPLEQRVRESLGDDA